MEIRTKGDALVAYAFLKMAQQSGQKDLELKQKRAIRAWNNAPISEIKVIGGDWDERIELFPLPNQITSKEEAEKYTKNEIEIPKWHSAYDCTGKEFTVWSKVCRRAGRWWAYHKIAIDV